MKTRLDELTLHEYIELCAGDLSVLGGGTENAREEAALRLKQDYKRVADPSGYNSAVAQVEGWTRLSAEAGFYRMVANLTAIEAFTEARSLLDEAGRDVRHIPDAGLHGFAVAELRRALFERSRAGERRKAKSGDGGKGRKPEDVREAFHKEVATVMVYFKMTIDPHTTSALVYAAMVNQAREDARMRSEMVRGMRRKGY